MGYPQKYIGHLLFESNTIFEEALTAAKKAANEDHELFSDTLLRSRLSTHFFFIDWDTYMPASCWFNFQSAIGELTSRCVDGYIDMTFESADGNDYDEWQSEKISGFTTLQYPNIEKENGSSLFPVDSKKMYLYNAHYSAESSFGLNRKTEFFSFTEITIHSARLFKMKSDTNWFFQNAFIMNENDCVYLVFRGHYRDEIYESGQFGPRHHSKQLLFSPSMKPGDVQILYAYGESSFFAVTAEGYDSLQTLAGDFPKCLRVRIDYCLHNAKEKAKDLPWESAPWGKYICDTSFMWLAAGTGMIKYQDAGLGNWTLLLKSISTT